MPSRAIALITACTLSALAAEAQALGFGRLSASAVLGQPLDLPVPLHLEPGEVIEPSCVQAEVQAGDNRWSRNQVRARLEPGADAGTWVARVVSTTVVEEPVVEITLTVGCDRRFSRKFVAFADPPLGLASRREPAPVVAAPSPVVQAAPLAAEPLPPLRSSGPAVATQAAPAPARKGAAKAPAHAALERPAGKPRRPTTPPAMAVAPRAAPDNGARLLLDVGGPRLKLDIEDPIFMPAPPAEGAASAVETDAGDAQRLQVLEKALSDLQREGRSSREATAVLNKRLAEAEAGRQALPWLAGLLALAIGVVVWLAWRLRQQQAQVATQPDWWAAQPPEPGISAPMDLLPDLPPLPPQGSWPEPPVPEGDGQPAFDDTGSGGEATAPLPATYALERSAASAPQPPAMEAPHERTMALGPAVAFLTDRSPAEVAGAREVSVEELLDLEQQADFFLALGQEDAAIDLLMSHLRSTGGQSPLPYTKLLEIYRRQEDREAYERIRARFNRRFNAYAPDWEAGPFSGRALEDYPQAVGQLQSLWPEPLDAMALLEAMLFRKDAAHELFDLQAYKDVLLLYSLARDLWLQNGGLRAGGVDVLLPLEEDPSHPGEGGATVEPTQFQLTAYAPPPRAAAAGDDEQDDVDTRR